MPDIWASHAVQQSYRELPEAQLGSDPTLNLCSYSHTNRFNALHQRNIYIRISCTMSADTSWS